MKVAFITGVTGQDGAYLSEFLLKKGYQVHLANKIKKETKIITRTTGMITNLNQAQKIINNNKADIVNMARKFIKSPTWLINEIKKKNKKIFLSKQYERCF